MKIRTNFVSNSSSTSFIIAMNDDFELTEKERKKIYDNSYDFEYKGEYPKEYFNKKLNEFVRRLKELGLCWAYDDGDPTFSCYTFCYAVERILIGSIEHGPGSDEIYNILGGKDKNKNIMKLMEQLKGHYTVDFSYDSEIKHDGDAK